MPAYVLLVCAKLIELKGDEVFIQWQSSLTVFIVCLYRLFRCSIAELCNYQHEYLVYERYLISLLSHVNGVPVIGVTVHCNPFNFFRIYFLFSILLV